MLNIGLRYDAFVFVLNLGTKLLPVLIGACTRSPNIFCHKKSVQIFALNGTNFFIFIQDSNLQVISCSKDRSRTMRMLSKVIGPSIIIIRYSFSTYWNHVTYRSEHMKVQFVQEERNQPRTNVS